MTGTNSSRKKLLRFTAFSLLLSGCFVASMPSPARAESLETLLPYVIENHDRVRSSKAKLSAARNRAREALGGWFPTLSQTANAGHETQQNDGSADTKTGFSEYDISLTQLLWDFGSTNGAIDKARLEVESARYDLIETRQSLILEAITAYMNTIRSNAALGFAKDSEDNIRRQTGLEEALVGLGSGFSTDVLQAKTQLAGAQARRAQSEGGLVNALNRFQAVYGRMPDNIKDLTPVPYPAAFLPITLTQATDIALASNPSLKNAILDADIAVEDVRIARADNFTPKIEASAERKLKKNVGGTIGPKEETLAKVEMTFDFNLGFTAVNTLRASKDDLSATTYTAADTRRTIEEQVRNAWQQLETAKQTASHLNNQANIAAAFLELARNERQLGRRSLIDVLSGETNLINAKSDALSAETDVLLAAYGLLAATGQLEYEVISRSKGIKAPTIKQPASSGPTGASAPTPSPVLPVTPENKQSGEIDPDVTVASGRSASDLLAMYAMAEQADINALPNVSKTYGHTSDGSKLNVQSTPAQETQTRYTYLHDQDTDASMVETMATYEFASRDQVLNSTPIVDDRLPPQSDTAIQSTSADEDTVYESFASDDDIVSGDTAPISAIEVATVDDTTSAGDENPISNGLSDVFSFFAEAAQANEESALQADTHSEAQPVVEVASAPANTPVDDPSSEPVSDVLGNIVTFFENAQPLETEEEYTPVVDADDTQVVSRTPDSAPAEPAQQAVSTVETDETGSLFDLFDFLEAAHQRSLESNNAENPSEPASAPAQAQEIEPETQVTAEETKSSPTELFAFIGDVLSGDGLEKIDMSYTPLEPDSFYSSDRG